MCGDAIVRTGVEECDDGNQNNTDDCLVSCQEAGCGDGYLTSMEECDDGNIYNEDTCTSGCRLAVCGDSYVQFAFEECDDGNIDPTDLCTADCKKARCGDGIINGNNEECDDSGISNDCNKECKIVRRLVFVTHKVFSGGIGGLPGADQECQLAALAGGLDNPLAFKAWLADDEQGPADRFDTEFSGIYTLVNGIILANGWDGLTDGSLDHAIDVDEDGMNTSGLVWSNVLSNGKSVSKSADCENWYHDDPGEVGMVGNMSAMSSMNIGWTDFFYIACLDVARIYCFEDLDN